MLSFSLTRPPPAALACAECLSDAVPYMHVQLTSQQVGAQKEQKGNN